MDPGFILLCLALLGWLLSPWMVPMVAVREQLGVLLAADATTLAPAGSGNVVAVIIAPFTLVETLTVGDLTLASTNGLSPIVCATGAQEVANDPTSGAQLITIVPASGSGFRWVTSGTFPPSITVYGYALCTTALGALLGVQVLATPITLATTGQQIDADPLQMVFVPRPLS
jgi:hypothetical protein